MVNMLPTVILVAALAGAAACASGPTPAVPVATDANETAALEVPTAQSCLDAQTPSPRPKDAAAHVYDTAVYSYLHTQVSSIGRELLGDENRNALAVTDDEVYRLCVQWPENCLREQLAQAGDKTETLALLTTRGAYAYERALLCLVREGARYQSEGRPETYDERVAVHLVGAALPVGTLRETDYYGHAGPERLGRAEANLRRCYDHIAGEPPLAGDIAKRVDADLLTVIDCGDGGRQTPPAGRAMAE